MLPEIDAIGAIVAAHIDLDGPGAAVALIKHGELLHAKGYGFASLEWRQPVAPDTVFGIGSLTKPFTATAILVLERDGKLRLDDPITAYLPDYPLGDRPITIAHLLTHTSGIVNFVTQPGFWERTAMLPHTPRELLDLFTSLPPNFAPGERYSYSNSAYCLLGLIIETISGMPYGAFMREHVFAPLGMPHSHYLLDEQIIPHRASGYMRTERGHERAPQFSMTLPYAAGGLGSSLDDLIQWDRALREQRLLDAEAYQRMRTPVRLNDGRTEDYGFGLALSNFRGRSVLHHAGGVPGFSSFYGHLVEDDNTIIVLSNIGLFDAGGLARDICASVLRLPATPRTPAFSPAPDTIRKMVGVYSDGIFTFTVTQDAHGLHVSGDADYDLELVSENVARAVADDDVAIFFADDGPQGYTRAKAVVPFFWVSGYRVTDDQRNGA